jgi:hypothetical protein
VRVAELKAKKHEYEKIKELKKRVKKGRGEENRNG